MKKINTFKSTFLATLGVILFAGTFVQAQDSKTSRTDAAGTTTQNVKVVNTSAEPVPVAVSGTPTVVVTNSSANPLSTRDVEKKQSFNATISANLSAGAFSASVTTTNIVVPAGKRLVIKHTSAWVLLPAGQIVYGGLQVANTVGASPAFTHYFVLSRQTDGAGNDILTAAQPMELYMDAGNEGSIVFARNSSVGSGLIFVTVTGYLVDAQ